jgi:hypothetical protein
MCCNLFWTRTGCAIWTTQEIHPGDEIMLRFDPDSVKKVNCVLKLDNQIIGDRAMDVPMKLPIDLGSELRMDLFRV